MGADPETSVTSADGRVHGLDNLMIFDASIYPVHTSSNTNLPVLMAAEKLSSEFLGTR
jgi:choline dehydrogenase-like flavoprotein